MFSDVTASQTFHPLFWQCMKILGKPGKPEAPHDDVLAFYDVQLSLDTAVSRLQQVASPHTRNLSSTQRGQSVRDIAIVNPPLYITPLNITLFVKADLDQSF
jgi:hypothetical protein